LFARHLNIYDFDNNNDYARPNHPESNHGHSNTKSNHLKSNNDRCWYNW
jgi:hypothetical protein